MYLINIKTLALEEFASHPPKYAILSHTWSDGEVTFDDFHDTERRESLEGFDKIKRTCEQARLDGLEYAWIDTCCINKISSAELSESINSMFKWYSDAAVCYAFLEDLPEGVELPITDPSVLADCRWFSRGWTLQELLAPREIVFFDAAWKRIHKNEVEQVLGQATGIPDDVLSKKTALEDVSVANRMSWASERQTKREEDMAYCLLGVFDVNMPMLYGEGGKRAFIRLQEEIVRNIQDDTLFAWEATEESAAEAPFRGLFASSPAEFASIGNLIPFHPSTAAPTNVMGNGRVVLSCSIHDRTRDRAVAGLKCVRGKDLSHTVGIPIVRIENNVWLRAKPSSTVRCSHGPHDELTFQRHAEKREAKPTNNLFRGGLRLAPLPRGIKLCRVLPERRFSNWDPDAIYPLADLFGGITFELSVSCSSPSQDWDSAESFYIEVRVKSAVENTYVFNLSETSPALLALETDTLLSTSRETQEIRRLSSALVVTGAYETFDENKVFVLSALVSVNKSFKTETYNQYSLYRLLYVLVLIAFTLFYTSFGRRP